MVVVAPACLPAIQILHPSHGVRARDTLRICGPHHMLDARKQWQHIINRQTQWRNGPGTTLQESRKDAASITRKRRNDTHGTATGPLEKMFHTLDTPTTQDIRYIVFGESGTGGKHLRLGKKSHHVAGTLCTSDETDRFICTTRGVSACSGRPPQSSPGPPGSAGG